MFSTPIKIDSQQLSEVMSYSGSERDLDSAIDNADFSALEKIGNMMTLLAQKRDITGIRRIAGMCAARKPCDDTRGQGPPTSSTTYSTPDTIVASPHSPISPSLTSSFFVRSRPLSMSYSKFITTVKTGPSGLVAEKASRCLLLRNSKEI